MLLQDKMTSHNFSPSEQVVVDFILEKQELIQDYSTTMIASVTYTSPSILIRIAKKLGYAGFSAFKKAYLEEIRYLQTNFNNIDANFPFGPRDSAATIASKLVALKQESLHDTLSLLDVPALTHAIELIEHAETLKVFTIANNTFHAEEFVFKMRHIGKRTETFSFSNTMYQEATMSKSQDVALLISYSGESGEVIAVVKRLKENNVPIILLTSIGENTLSQYATVRLNITTREKSYSKLGAFSSLESLNLLLDTLYACYLNLNYEKRYAYKLEMSKQTETRNISNEIILD